MSKSNVDLSDVQAVRFCAQEFQRLNEKHNGGSPGNGNIRLLSERVVKIADTLESRLVVR